MRGETMKDKSKKSTYSTTFDVDPSTCRMRGESMKGKSKKSTYSTTFDVDPKMVAGPGIEPGTQGFSVLRSTN